MLLLIIAVVVVLLALMLAVWTFGERGHLLLPSTVRTARRQPGAPTAGRAQSVTARLTASLHAYVYGRWTNQYVYALVHYINPRLGPKGKKVLSDSYHAKVLTHDQARAIINLNEPIRRDLEQIVPYPLARDLVLNASPEVAVYECGCRHARTTPCQPTQVCMVIGEPGVSFIVEHNPYSSRCITQSEALELLRAEYERGHLHSAWFKSCLHDRFYAICNCCKCCCGGIEAMKKYGIPMVTSSGFVARADAALCNACGACAEKCAFDAITVNGSAVIEWSKCMGCGVCVGQCPVEALSLVRDEKKGVPLDVRMLTQQNPAS
jgi:ferredoxin